MLKVLDLHVCVQSNLYLELLSGVGGNCQYLTDLQVSVFEGDVELLFAGQT